MHERVYVRARADTGGQTTDCPLITASRGQELDFARTCAQPTPPLPPAHTNGDCLPPHYLPLHTA